MVLCQTKIFRLFICVCFSMSWGGGTFCFLLNFINVMIASEVSFLNIVKHQLCKTCCTWPYLALCLHGHLVEQCEVSPSDTHHFRLPLVHDTSPDHHDLVTGSTAIAPLVHSNIIIFFILCAVSIYFVAIVNL